MSFLVSWERWSVSAQPCRVLMAWQMQLTGMMSFDFSSILAKRGARQIAADEAAHEKH
jgi:hypothetical protein